MSICKSRKEVGTKDGKKEEGKERKRQYVSSPVGEPTEELMHRFSMGSYKEIFTLTSQCLGELNWQVEVEWPMTLWWKVSPTKVSERVVGIYLYKWRGVTITKYNSL